MRAIACLSSYWALLAAGFAALLAYLLPQGAEGYEVVTPPLIGVLFAIVGLTARLAELRSAATAAHLHVLFQLYSLLIIPMLYYGCVYYWHWDVSSGLLTRPLSIGMMVAMVMPTTAATVRCAAGSNPWHHYPTPCAPLLLMSRLISPAHRQSLVFVAQVGGDTSVAAFNMALGQMCGTASAPLMAVWLVGGQAGASRVPAALLKMTEQIIVPMVGGIAVQLLMRGRQRRAHHHLKRLAVLNMPLLFILLYLIFAKAFSAPAGSLTTTIVARLTLWVTAIHLLFLALAYGVARACKLSRARRVAFLFVAPQKTEGLALAVLSSIFCNDPALPIAELALPCIAYHSVQMVVASLIVPLLKPPAAGLTAEAEAEGECAAQAEGAERVAAEAEAAGKAPLRSALLVGARGGGT